MARLFPISDSYNYSKTNELLSRDWFCDDEGIHDVLECADDNAWKMVNINRSNYSSRVRDAINYYNPRKSTVREISDSDMLNIQRKKTSDLKDK